MPSRRILIPLCHALAAWLLACPAAFAEEPAPLLDYSIDLVSDYVARGEDLYVRRFDKAGEAHSAVNVAPALQPSVTLHGPGAMSLGLWASFALTDRDDDNARGFLGLGRDDELDVTLDLTWSNRLGGFSTGFVTYAYRDSCYGAAAPCTRSSPAPAAVSPEVFVVWRPSFAEAVHGYFGTYVAQEPGASYTLIGASGGERLVWAADIGTAASGLQDVTAKIGWSFGVLTASLSGSYRPNPELIGPYRKDGSYLVRGKSRQYPPTVYWLTLSHGGSVAAN